MFRTVARLLPQLRRVMESDETAANRLQHIVQLIAKELKVEVCSCYILRAGEVLELFAAVGLNPAAIHNTRLRIGEGLVGTIAASAAALATPDAFNHPQFAARPETGEEQYKSFCGVPLLRNGRVRGVLVMQSRRTHDYDAGEIDVLQTLGMLVTELVASGELISLDERVTNDDPNLQALQVPGIAFNSGIAVGRAVLHQRIIDIHHIVADDPALEQSRFDTALTALQKNLDELLARADADTEHFEILETYRMFADDRGWRHKIRDRIRQGLTAEAAVKGVHDDTLAKLNKIHDPYLKERAQDFANVSARLLSVLAGHDISPVILPDNTILIAHDFGAADMLDYDQTKISAIVLEAGSPSSHVTIMARALGVPVIGQCRTILKSIENGDVLIVDGDNAIVHIRPLNETIESYNGKRAAKAVQQAAAQLALRGPVISRDGTRVELHINAGLLNQVPDLTALDADGIGLYRTEMAFMALGRYPSMQEQTQIYARVLMEANNKPVVFRTLDIGSDKKLPYLPQLHEDNPALGWRGLRVGLDRPAILRHQLRALILAAYGRPLAIMLPMVSQVSDVRRARQMLDMEIAIIKQRGIRLPAQIRLGVMFEVPALFWQLPELLPLVDFMSVGSNDLFQYTFAVDRSSAAVQESFDGLCPGFLRALRDLNVACQTAQVPLSLCGEMGGRPLDALALLALGYRSFSMSAPAIGPIKAMVKSVRIPAAAAFLKHLLDSGQEAHYRGRLRAFAMDNGIDLGETLATYA